MGRTRAGFSLAEILAVVLVLSIVAAVAIPNLSATDPNKLELASQEFAQAIRFARAEARRTGLPHGFELSPGERRIRVFRPDTATTPWSPQYDVLHPIQRRPYDVALDRHRFARAESLTRTPTYRGACNAPDRAWFDAQGVARCSDPPQILLEAIELRLGLAGQTRTLRLEGITGRVTVQ